MSAPVIRAETADDGLGVFAAVKAAFGRDDEARLVDALRANDDVVLALVAELSGVIVGTVVFSRVWIETDDARAAAVALAPLAVAPAFQRTGVGSLLTFEALAKLKASGERLVLVLGEPAYYRRFGFRADLARGFDAPWAGSDAFMALTFGPDAPLEGRAVYPDAFAAR